MDGQELQSVFNELTLKKKQLKVPEEVEERIAAISVQKHYFTI